MLLLLLLQEEYKRGVSAWNFDVKSLKEQAEKEGESLGLASIAEEPQQVLCRRYTAASHTSAKGAKQGV